jgi:Ca-activated chloride channel family protein
LGLSFALHVVAPEDLAHDARRVDALVTVTAARSAGAAAPAAPSAEILIMDRSLSMSGHRLDEAKRAMCAAIDTLRDGTLLAVVAGHHTADVIFPAGGGLARVDATAREDAKLRVVRQLAEGGTAIGQWLDCARRLFSSVTSPGTVRHAVLYTDGKDEHETPAQLGDVLTACADRFVCDARGLGDDWHYADLLRITEALHGTAAPVVTVSDLTEDFTGLMRQAQRIVVPRVYLGLRLNDRFQLASVRQTRPTDAELTARQQHDEEIHVPLGSWPPETREYRISLRFDPDTLTVGEELRAARVTLHAERPDGTRGPCSERAAMVVRRRSTPGYGIPRSPDLTHWENQRELGMAMRACADAHARGDLEQADRELRLAIGFAEGLRDSVRLKQLRAVASTGPDGRVRLRRDVSRGQIQALGLFSTRTAGVPPVRSHRPPPDAAAPPRVCPHCHTPSTAPGAGFCENCGRPLGEAGPGGEPVDAS